MYIFDPLASGVYDIEYGLFSGVIHAWTNKFDAVAVAKAIFEHLKLKMREMLNVSQLACTASC